MVLNTTRIIYLSPYKPQIERPLKAFYLGINLQVVPVIIYSDECKNSVRNLMCVGRYAEKM